MFPFQSEGADMKLSTSMKKIQMIKVIVVVSGLVLILAGVLMIYRDVPGEGDITIDTPVLKGNITSTKIGLLVIFCGVVLEAAVVLKSYTFQKKVRVIQSPELSIREDEETGMCTSADPRDGE